MTCREFEKQLNDWKGNDGALGALSPHSDDCHDCRRKLEMHAEVMASLNRLAEAGDSVRPDASVERELRRAFLLESTERTAPAAGRVGHHWGVAAAILLLVAVGVLVGIQFGTSPGAPPTAGPSAEHIQQEDPRVAVGSDFIRIGGCLDPECLRNSQLMRVRISRSSLLHFGLPMNAELAENEVLADVLVAEDGSAQAIRFVNY